MLPVTALLGFLFVVSPLVMTPGASFTLVSARAIAGDHRGAWAVIGGTAVGIATHAILAGLGLAAVVMQSAEIYRVIRWAGAAYVVGLGLVMLWRSRKRPDAEASEKYADLSGGLASKAWRAYVANVLNVKAASVYLTLGPQFVRGEDMGVTTMLQLAGIHVLVMTIWLGIWAAGLTRATRRFDTNTCRRAMDRLGGIALVAIGARNAVHAR